VEHDHDLEWAVYDTIRYFDIYDMPLTTTQIWRSLNVDREGSGVRWHGRQVPRLREIRDVLTDSIWLSERVVTAWGYYCLTSSAGKNIDQVKMYVRARLRRHVLAQHKWKITRRVVRLLAPLPFVRMIGGSGSLALYNTRPSSDLDLYLVVRSKRIWTARLLVLLVTQLTGRRRKYWDEEAPDKICLNHYVTDQSMTMPVENRNLYTAQLYGHMIPLVGLDVFSEWLSANEPWIKRWLMYPAAPLMRPRQFLSISKLEHIFKSLLEGFLLEPLGDMFERWAGRVQRRVIAAHTKPGQLGRVVLSGDELAFHPDTQAPGVLATFSQDEGQRQLI